MDSFGDVAGVATVVTMIWLGGLAVRSAWRELAEQQPPRRAPASTPPGDVWLPLLMD